MGTLSISKFDDGNSSDGEGRIIFTATRRTLFVVSEHPHAFCMAISANIIPFALHVKQQALPEQHTPCTALTLGRAMSPDPA